MVLHGIWLVLFRSCSQLLSALSRNLSRNPGDSLSWYSAIPLMDYSLNRIRRISGCRLLLGELQLPVKQIWAEHQLPPFQNFASFKLATSCTTPWHPLEMHDVLFAFTAGSKSGSAVCTAPSSKERAPRWQCRHSRLL